jgi:hypothetical protein
MKQLFRSEIGSVLANRDHLQSSRGECALSASLAMRQAQADRDAGMLTLEGVNA